MENYIIEKEVWKDVAGYEGIYQVSSFGNVKSLERTVKSNYGRFRKQYERILKPGTTPGGYLVVVLRKNNKSRTFTVHGLVVNSFIRNSDKSLQVNHIDGNKKNNHLENLELVSISDNMKHASNTGLRIIKLTRQDAEDIRSLYKNSTINQSQLGEMYGVTKQTVSDICRYRTWK